MKSAISFITFTATLAFTWSAPLDEPIPIIHQDSDVNVDGNFRFSYETGNGIIVNEQGVLKNPGVKDLEAEEVSGSYAYTSPEGKLIKLSYVANENGFQPSGDHLPAAHGLL